MTNDLRVTIARAIHRYQPAPPWEACLERADVVLDDLVASGYQVVKLEEQ
ncbi:hypothetical protein AB0395_48225 [Streptosporangium sp. NPDC051023]